MTPKEIVETMMHSDAFSQELGMRIEHIDFGTCTLVCTVTDKMVNGFHIAHGGITYSLADSALAFASNSHGQHCVSIETSIAHIKPATPGDILTAKCTEIQRGKTIGRYQTTVHNQHNHLIASFHGTVFRTEKHW